MDFHLQIDKVSKRFGDVVAVDGISAAIPKGCIYGFLGPNGAGKTTTIRMVMSILYPDEGAIHVLGNRDPEAVKDRLGYLPEEKGLYKKMKTGELVAYFGMLKGLPGREARAKAHRLLEEYGLGNWIDKKCDSLSKGMGQKVQLISTLIHDPDLVILDEPFSGLDPVNVDVVRNTILSMKRAGKTVIFSTHVMEQAEQMCDYILLINRGRKILDGSLAKVKATGDKAVQIDFDGDDAAFADFEGIRKIRNTGKTAEIFLEEGRDPQALLSHLVGRVAIRRFDIRDPSLHEIFVRAVGGDTHA